MYFPFRQRLVKNEDFKINYISSSVTLLSAEVINSITIHATC